MLDLTLHVYQYPGVGAVKAYLYEVTDDGRRALLSESERWLALDFDAPDEFLSMLDLVARWATQAD